MHRNPQSILRLTIYVCLSGFGLAMSSAAGAACTGENTCYGIDALPANTGVNNSAFGFEALFSNISTGTGDGNWNTAIGHRALRSNTGTGNTAIGAGALFQNTSGGLNTAIGYGALAGTTGSDNTAVGGGALSGFSKASNNTAVGTESLNAPIGEGNSAFGFRAMNGSDHGTENTALGTYALRGFETNSSEDEFHNLGHFNTASGAHALENNYTGSSNTGSGVNALFSNTTGFYNTADGVGALKNSTTGFRNVALGYQAGFAVTTGSDNIVIGGGNQGKANENGVIRIGISANQKKTFVAGISGVKTGLAAAKTVFIDANGQLGTIKSSQVFKEDIHPMGSVSERLYALRPVTFRYTEAYDDGSKPVEFGLIAEEVAEAFPELVVYDANGLPETVRYDLVATLLLNEFQKERGVVQAQAVELAQLRQEFATMAEVIERLDNARRVAKTH